MPVSVLLPCFILSVSQDAVTVISARQICVELINHINGLTDDNLAVLAFQELLSRMQSRIIAFEAQVRLLFLFLQIF